MGSGPPVGVPRVSPDALRAAIRELNLPGRPVLVHASLRSFGWLAGGPDTVINAFLAEMCTILVPAFSPPAYYAPPPPGVRVQRNGMKIGHATYLQGAARYSPVSNDVAGYVGRLPATLLMWRDRVRGNHRLNSFAAIGPLAERLTVTQKPLDVYGPIRELIALQGSVLLVGVGLESATIIHPAEQLAGRRLFRRWGIGPDGHVVEAETGGCSRGFGQLDPIVSRLERRVRTGDSLWRCFEAGPLAETVARAIREDPGITRCGDADCERCRDAVAGGPLD